MDIDLSVLRSLESEKDISMDLAIKAIEDALLRAYQSTTGAAATARVEIDRGSGHVTVWADACQQGLGLVRGQLEPAGSEPQGSLHRPHGQPGPQRDDRAAR